VHVISVNVRTLNKALNLFALHDPAVGVTKHCNQGVDENKLGQNGCHDEVEPQKDSIVTFFV